MKQKTSGGRISWEEEKRREEKDGLKRQGRGERRESNETIKRRKIKRQERY